MIYYLSELGLKDFLAGAISSKGLLLLSYRVWILIQHHIQVQLSQQKLTYLTKLLTSILKASDLKSFLQYIQWVHTHLGTGTSCCATHSCAAQPLTLLPWSNSKGSLFYYFTFHDVCCLNNVLYDLSTHMTDVFVGDSCRWSFHIKKVCVSRGWLKLCHYQKYICIVRENSNKTETYLHLWIKRTTSITNDVYPCINELSKIYTEGEY